MGFYYGVANDVLVIAFIFKGMSITWLYQEVRYL